MRYILKIFFVLVIQLNNGQAQIDLTPVKSLSTIEQEYITLSNFSYPNLNESLVDSLLNNNLTTFESLLDLAFLIKYDSLYNPRMYRLIEGLETEQTEQIQQEIAIELSSYNKEVLVQLDKSQCTLKSFIYWRNIIRTLVLGYEFEDFIVENRMDNISSLALPDKVYLNYYFSLQGKFTREREYLQQKMAEYISSTSYKGHEEYYHNLVLNTYKKGTLHPNYRHYIIKEIIKQEVINENEHYLNDYLSQIHKINKNEALQIINYIAEAKKSSYPQIFLNLLSSENEEYIGRTIDWSSNCWDGRICVKVKSKLKEIFETGSYKLKLKAAFVLMHDYNDLSAYNYLISVVESKKAIYDDYKSIVINWLGDPCNNGKTMTSRLNKALKPYLQSENFNIKRATIETYLNYKNQYVIEAIIPQINFKIEYISLEIRERLIHYEDKEFTIETIKIYLAKNQESKYHWEILNELDN